jgi:hypothetical protein
MFLRNFCRLPNYMVLHKTALSVVIEARIPVSVYFTVQPVLNGISRVQNIFPLKLGLHLIKIYYDSHGT